MGKRIILIVLLCIALAPAFTQTKWELAKDKNGIKVYSAKEGTSKFKSIKVEAVLEGTLEKLLKVLIDANGNKEWVYRTSNSYTIKRFSPTEVLSYTETSVPWPASNRDVPLRMLLHVDQKNNALKLTAVGEPNAIPKKEGVVRIPYFNSWWDVRFDGKNKLVINYFLAMDPGGSIPAWITNMFVAKGPFETFNNLASVLKKPNL
jgi:hypothetical protein